jgi:hypothetical protein
MFASRLRKQAARAVQLRGIIVLQRRSPRAQIRNRRIADHALPLTNSYRLPDTATKRRP